MSTKQKIKLLRASFNQAVLDRDGHRCRVCGKIPENGDDGLDVHHIQDRHDMPNGGYAPENGIALCKGDRRDDCHWKAEAEHRGETPEPGYSSAELYSLIGTTFDAAWEASERLSSSQA